MRGAGESGGGGGLVTELDVDAEIPRGILPQERGIGGQRIDGARHYRDRLIADVDPLGGVFGRRDGVGHDHRNGLADKPHLVGRQRVIEGGDRLQAPLAHGNVRRPIQRGIVRDRPKPVGEVIGAAQHREHAGCRERRLLVDRDDAGMGMRRAHDHSVGHTRQRDVVAKAAISGQEATILLTPHRLTDAVRHPSRCHHACSSLIDAATLLRTGGMGARLAASERRQQ